MLGQQGLVGGDDVLAGLQCPQAQSVGGLDAAHHFHNDVDLRVVHDGSRIGDQYAVG